MRYVDGRCSCVSMDGCPFEQHFLLVRTLSPCMRPFNVSFSLRTRAQLAPHACKFQATALKNKFERAVKELDSMPSVDTTLDQQQHAYEEKLRQLNRRRYEWARSVRAKLGSFALRFCGPGVHWVWSSTARLCGVGQGLSLVLCVGRQSWKLLLRRWKP